jgi:hypothetical protein
MGSICTALNEGCQPVRKKRIPFVSHSLTSYIRKIGKKSYYTYCLNSLISVFSHDLWNITTSLFLLLLVVLRVIPN